MQTVSGSRHPPAQVSLRRLYPPGSEWVPGVKTGSIVWRGKELAILPHSIFAQDCMSPPKCFQRSSSTGLKHQAVRLSTSRTLSHKSSFIPRTCNLWTVLPSSCFPESYNLPSFKSKINKLDLLSLSYIVQATMSFPQHNSLKKRKMVVRPSGYGAVLRILCRTSNH